MKLKSVIMTACMAFVLSFLIALISRVGMPRALFRAAISAVIFGAVACLIQFLYSRFLSDVSSGASDSEVVEDTKPVTGSLVNLVVNDEELEEEEGGPQFSVDAGSRILAGDDIKPIQMSQPAGGSYGKTSLEDIGKSDGNNIAAVSAKTVTPASTPVAPAVAVDSGFKPVNLADAASLAGAASVPAESQLDQPARQFSPVKFSVNDDQLDELPDVSELGILPGKNIDDVIKDSDFATEGRNSAALKAAFGDGIKTESKDTALMAEAIRTVLAKE